MLFPSPNDRGNFLSNIDLHTIVYIYLPFLIWWILFNYWTINYAINLKRRCVLAFICVIWIVYDSGSKSYCACFDHLFLTKILLITLRKLLIYFVRKVLSRSHPEIRGFSDQVNHLLNMFGGFYLLKCLLVYDLIKMPSHINWFLKDSCHKWCT